MGGKGKFQIQNNFIGGKTHAVPVELGSGGLKGEGGDTR